MENTEIKSYWENRAIENKSSVTGTTNDVYLRELEIKTFCDHLSELEIQADSKILDIGCGDGYTTLNIAKHFPESQFIGIDYSPSMIQNAESNLKDSFPSLNNISFQVGDATKVAESLPASNFDFILTDRCLINLDSNSVKYQTIYQISTLLKPQGHYLAIENFVEGQDNLNNARKHMGLNEISVRWHNHFFKEDEFLQEVTSWFKEVNIIEFSSSYYFATRVIYSAMCKLNNVEPDYLHDIHKVSVGLPVFGKFSPIRLAILKK